MQPMAALLRRQPATPCTRSHGGPWQWGALRQWLSTLSASDEAASQQQGAAPAAAPPPPRQQQNRRRLSDVLAEERAPALALRRRVQEALERRQFGAVLQLLHDSEGISDSGGEPALAGSQPPPAASWHPYDRAALYDCALWACAQRADPDEARRLVDRMWREQVPVGILANTSVLKALCAVGRRATALDHLRAIPTKRQRTPMYTWLLRSCNEAGDLDVARECYALFQRRQLPPDARFVAEVMKMHGAAGDLNAAKAAWLAAAAAAEGRPDAGQACLHAAWVAALAQAGRLQEATGALAAMLDRFASVLPVEVSLPRSGSSSCSEDGEPRPQLPGGVPASSGSSSSGSADGGGGTERQPPAVRTVHHLQEARNAVMAAARERGEHSVAKRVASLATLRGLPPDVGTYNGLLLGTLSHGDGLQAVLEGVQEMRALGMRPDWQTYAILLQAASAEQDAAAAQAALDAMPADGVVPSRLHHNLLLQAFSTAGDLQGVDTVYRRMRAAGFSPNAHTFDVLLGAVRHWSALEVAGRAEMEDRFEAKRERSHERQLAAQLLAGWAADLDAARPRPLNAELFTQLLHAYGKCGQIYHVLALMRAAFGVRLPPNTEGVLGRASSSSSGGSSSGGGRSEEEAAEAAAAAGQAEHGDIAALKAAMAEDSSSAGGSDASSSSGSSSAGGGDASSSSIGGSGEPAHSGDGGLRCPLSSATLERARLQPSLRIFNAAIGACTRVGHEHLADAVALLRAMLAAGLSPDVHTYTSLISGCAYGRQAALARELLRQMRQRGIEPTIWTYNALLNVECWTYGVDAGAALLQSFVAQGVQPDRATWNTLLASARHFKRADVASWALEQLAGEQQREDAAAAEAAEAQQEAAAAAAAAGEPALDDHRWHGYYERQQDEEDEW
ncbi:hypothetical protein ABPG75_004353 [Micractinium tetrahymenae]